MATLAEVTAQYYAERDCYIKKAQEFRLLAKNIGPVFRSILQKELDKKYNFVKICRQIMLEYQNIHYEEVNKFYRDWQKQCSK